MHSHLPAIKISGFTEDAQDVTRQASVRLINLDELVEMVLERYEDLPVEVKELVPLRKLYVPELRE